MHTTASRFTLRKNAERAAQTMIRKGTAPAVDYDINPSGDGRFEIRERIRIYDAQGPDVELGWIAAAT